MGEARRRKQFMGSIYGTPKGARHLRSRLDPESQQRLLRLGLLVKGRQKEGDPFWCWLALEIRRIAGDLDDIQLRKAAGIISASMGLRGQQAENVEDIIWMGSPAMYGSFDDHVARLQSEIAHCGFDPAQYEPSGI